MIKKEKIKEWLNEKKEKGVNWCVTNRGKIFFGLGMAAAGVGFLAAEKLHEPKEGAIGYTPNGEDLDARIFVRDRFGRESNMLNVRYRKSDSDLLLGMSDAIGKFCNSGD